MKVQVEVKRIKCSRSIQSVGKLQNMEIETQSGSKIQLKNPSETIDFGRGFGFNSTDRTVSRHHISFKLNESQTGVYFKVNGKNPVWVRDSSNDQIRVYRSSETGEINSGDSFCVSSKNPVLFNLNKIDENDSELKGEIEYGDVFAETSGIDYDDIETSDTSFADPVKEFNFVVMGHEFDSYSKKMIRDIRNWDWFLEEAKEESDEDSDRKTENGKRRKRKKVDDDDVWTGESEEEVVMIKKVRNLKPKYSTRSKKQEKNKKGASTSKSVKVNTKKNEVDDDQEDDDDENDETLGGFIVDDEDIGEGNDEDDEEEEMEFEEDDDDDE